MNAMIKAQASLARRIPSSLTRHNNGKSIITGCHKASLSSVLRTQLIIPHHLTIGNTSYVSTSYYSSTTISSSSSSFAEPEPSLFNGIVVDPTDKNDDPDKQLRADVKAMGTMLGSTIASYEGEDILNKVESLRLSAKVCHKDSFILHIIYFIVYSHSFSILLSL